MSLMEQFANPELFEKLSMGEKLTGATVTMCIGLGITFLVLLIIWACIAIMARFTGGKKSNEPAKATPAPAAAAPQANVTEAAQEVEGNDELVAVIAAAIAALEGTAVSNLVVNKITRTGGPTNAWTSAGLSECIDSRRM